MKTETGIILSVSQLNFYARSVMENDPVLSEVFVRGEISGLKSQYRSGHIYFSLKDDKASVNAVMFRDNASRLKFVPEEGMKVIIIGKVSVYEERGQFQLYVQQMQPDGIGELAAAFSQLKEKLARKGLFDDKYKKEIPQFPENIGVVTSASGAVRRDIENVLSRRFPLVNMILYPASVQGENAEAELIEGLRYFNENKNADVIIIGRGGGSAEDLQAFNSEALAYEIFASKIPIISAVGHATDYTICDFVADIRAQTPTEAAELAVPERSGLMDCIQSLYEKMNAAFENKISENQQRTDMLYERLSALSVEKRLAVSEQKLDGLVTRLENAEKTFFGIHNTELKRLISGLNALSPLKVLERGYSIASKNGKTVGSVYDVNENDKISVKMKDGVLICTVDGKEVD
ncbi:MAG: exodeoxyribonuclease VII large subunit [Clostridia bacterium]|nr:exodeoxyribonuclease VII large subunit [Clostridia bacterium]